MNHSPLDEAVLASMDRDALTALVVRLDGEEAAAKASWSAASNAADLARRALSTRMVDAGVQSTTANGRTVYLQQRFRAYKSSSVSDADFIAAIREAGLGDIIREGFAPQTLESCLRESWKSVSAEAPGCDPLATVPAPLRDKVTVAVLNEVRIRKAGA